MRMRSMVAEVLYRMALHEKTQKVYFLLPHVRKKLENKLLMFRYLIECLQSSRLSQSQYNKILRYIETHHKTFPKLNTNLLMNSYADEAPSKCSPDWNPEWTEIVKRMEEILQIAGELIKSGRCCGNKQWILCFMAFHNLPRVFFTHSKSELWSDDLVPLDVASALQASQYYFELLPGKQNMGE